MIIIESWSRQGANVVAEIKFDHAGSNHNASRSVPASQVTQLTPQRVLDGTIAWVNVKRMELDETALESLLNPLVGVDLEP